MPVLKKNAPKKAKAARMEAEMHKFKHGEMHSGSKTGPKVANRKQAIAIALHEAGESKKTGPTKAYKAADKAAHRRKRNIGR